MHTYIGKHIPENAMNESLKMYMIYKFSKIFHGICFDVRN